MSRSLSIGAGHSYSRQDWGAPVKPGQGCRELSPKASRPFGLYPVNISARRMLPMHENLKVIPQRIVDMAVDALTQANQHIAYDLLPSKRPRFG